MNKQPELTDVDEIYFSKDTESYMFDTADNHTRTVLPGNRQYAQISALVSDWEAEVYNEATIYRKPLVKRVSRNPGASVKGVGR